MFELKKKISVPIYQSQLKSPVADQDTPSLRPLVITLSTRPMGGIYIYIYIYIYFH